MPKDNIIQEMLGMPKIRQEVEQALANYAKFQEDMKNPKIRQEIAANKAALRKERAAKQAERGI